MRAPHGEQNRGPKLTSISANRNSLLIQNLSFTFLTNSLLILERSEEGVERSPCGLNIPIAIVVGSEVSEVSDNSEDSDNSDNPDNYSQRAAFSHLSTLHSSPINAPLTTDHKKIK